MKLQLFSSHLLASDMEVIDLRSADDNTNEGSDGTRDEKEIVQKEDSDKSDMDESLNVDEGYEHPSFEDKV